MTASENWEELQARQCPVCGSGKAASALFLKQSLDLSKIGPYSYASRKTPEFMRFELVTCRRCETIYASSAPPKGAITKAYHEASYDSAEEAVLAAETYAKALAPYLTNLPPNARALEIGTGTGIFLSQLQKAGFAEVLGIEPSQAAMDSADPAIRPFIREGIFVESEFAPESFDLICCFQTLEHVTDPRELVEASKRLLRKDGLLALVTHDYRAPVNRILGRRSPIIDIEHLQIFCRPSLSHLLTSAGLKTVTIESFANVYPLSYWLKLAPIPASLKEAVLGLFKVSGAADVKFRFNVGNLLSVGRKSA